MLTLAGCAEAIVSEDLLSQIRVARVQVSLAPEFQGVRGRNFKIGNDEVLSDLSESAEVALQGLGSGERNAILQISVTQFVMPSPGAQLLISNTPSSVFANVQVVDAASGEVLAGPERVVGTRDGVAGGIIGALATPPVEEDYRQTVEAFGVKIRTQIFGS